jgi:hypothetical protein
VDRPLTVEVLKEELKAKQKLKLKIITRDRKNKTIEEVNHG